MFDKPGFFDRTDQLNDVALLVEAEPPTATRIVLGHS
jgi:hypothetical protein